MNAEKKDTETYLEKIKKIKPLSNFELLSTLPGICENSRNRKLVDFKKTNCNVFERVPDGFDSKYEAYSLEVKRSKVTNEGIKAVIKADYYPGMVRGIDSLFQLFETVEDTEDPNLYEINYLPINV